MTKLIFSRSQQTTGIASLSNQDYATGRLQLEIERGRPFSILMVRFDGLGGATYRRGDASTDAVWGRVLGVLTKDLSSRDLCCRLGDEAFLLILPDRAAADCRRLLNGIQRRWMPLPSALEGKVEMKIGMASYPDQGLTVPDLFATINATVNATVAIDTGADRLRSMIHPRLIPPPYFPSDAPIPSPGRLGGRQDRVDSRHEAPRVG